MKKAYSNKEMRTDVLEEREVFFFPKNVPPVSVRAVSREEADAKLAVINKQTK